MRIYIASSLDNAEEVRALKATLISAGHIITYDWTVHGSAPDRVEELALTEMEGVCSADLVFVILPGGRGTHTELGIALGFATPVILVSDDSDKISKTKSTCAFYWNPSVLHVHKTRFGEFISDFLSRGFQTRFINGTSHNDNGWAINLSRYLYVEPSDTPNDLVAQIELYNQTRSS